MAINKDVIIIGAGPAGLAAAVKLKEQGINDILIIEREKLPGGYLDNVYMMGLGCQDLKKH